MKECSICFTDLDVNHYVEPEKDAEDEVVGETTRLKCGHAFHSSCILSSFRYNPSCPSCRSGGDQQHVLVQFIDNAILQEEEADQELMNKLHYIRRTDAKVIEARKLYKEKKIEFTRYCTTLQEKKKQMIYKINKELQKEKNAHTALFNKAKNELKKFRQLEMNAVRETYGEAVALELRDRLEIDYEPVLALRNPTTRRGFWIR